MNRTAHMQRLPINATGQKYDGQTEDSYFEEVSAGLRKKRTAKSQHVTEKQDLAARSVIDDLPEETDDCEDRQTLCLPVQLQDKADTATEADGKASLGQSGAAALLLQLPGTDGASILTELADIHQGGIFELLLPGGEKLAVAASLGENKVNFLLYPASRQRYLQLTATRKELEGGLERQMNKQVSVTILPWQSDA